MASLLKYLSSNRLFLALTLCTFAPVAAVPQNYQVSSNDIATGIRIGKLLDKAKKNFEKHNVKDLIKNMLDLKSETEACIGQKIDLDRSMDLIFQEMKIQGVKVNSNVQKAVSKIIKSKGKKYDHKMKYMEQCLINGIEYDSQDRKYSFLQEYGKSKDDGDIKEQDVPIRLLIGVTGALCGMFILLIPLPIPGKAQVGTFLITTGLKYAADVVIECEEEKQKEKKK